MDNWRKDSRSKGEIHVLRSDFKMKKPRVGWKYSGKYFQAVGLVEKALCEK